MRSAELTIIGMEQSLSAAHGKSERLEAAIKAALEKLAEHDPEAAHHILAAAISPASITHHGHQRHIV